MWRPARPEDDDEIVRMSIALFSEDPSPEPISEENVRRTLATLRTDPVRGRIVVLEIDGRVAGYSFLIPYWSNELGGEICIVDELYLDAAHRGHGHATALLTSLRDGYVALELEVTPANPRARALYERVGFRVKKNVVMRRRP